MNTGTAYHPVTFNVAEAYIKFFSQCLIEPGIKMRLNSTIEFKEFNFYILLNSSKQENTFFFKFKIWPGKYQYSQFDYLAVVVLLNLLYMSHPTIL